MIRSGVIATVQDRQVTVMVDGFAEAIPATLPRGMTVTVGDGCLVNGTAGAYWVTSLLGTSAGTVPTPSPISWLDASTSGSAVVWPLFSFCEAAGKREDARLKVGKLDAETWATSLAFGDGLAMYPGASRMRLTLTRLLVGTQAVSLTVAVGANTLATVPNLKPGETRLVELPVASLSGLAAAVLVLSSSNPMAELSVESPILIDWSI